MNIEEMKKIKQEKGYTYAQIAKLTGVPLGTVQKIFSGETCSPRYDTLRALEQLFTEPRVVQETLSYNVNKQGGHTIEDYYKLPDEQHVELIDGQFYDMSAPTTIHQRIVGEIHYQIYSYISSKAGKCISFGAPVDVQLDCDEKTMVQPDIFILCDENKLKVWGIYGAPDFVLEVISPSTKKNDYILKSYKYANAGVKEYWIVDSYQKKVLVYYFAGDVYPIIYGLDSEIPVNIYNGELKIKLNNIAKWIKMTYSSKY
jgi:Uma2 family endonuclease